MSWQDREKQGFRIVMDNGTTETAFYPDWLQQDISKKFEFNTSQFDFVNVKGTYVYRGMPRGQALTMVITFQGANNLDVSDNFKKWSEYRNKWTITHPNYNTLYVQPLSISFDNTQKNRTIITCEVIETNEVKPVFTPDFETQVSAAYSNSYAINDATLATSYKHYSTGTYVSLSNTILSTYNAFLSLLSDDITEYQSFTKSYNDVNSALNTAAFVLTDMTWKFGIFAKSPATFIIGIQNRLAGFTDALGAIYPAATPTIGVYAKRNIENQAASILASMFLSPIYNFDQQYRADIVTTMTTLTNAFGLYLDTLAGISTATGGQLNSYQPDPANINALSTLLEATLAYLQDKINQAQTEYIYILPKEMDVVDIAYKLYGLQLDDSTIQKLIATNKIGINGWQELLSLEKDTPIKYYA